ncbi:heparan sulfate glucosamine 3-O-sulfotransferase 1-like [Gigantopelta aegis]|uniref:heparan sulfate glucosamine 3-O-sulfotransferase 1-like n=1 Tax=Gigantopelta aegis TaxID=1735272 RepID=UPI001B88A59C|nr:heparan sulfate glucosamine 3-O-sulfotransferase 1-like [Gigantopelta aegis]
MLKRLAGYSPISFTDDHKVVKSHCSCFHLKLKCFFLIGALLLTIILLSWLSYSSHGARPSARPGTLQLGERVGHQHHHGSVVTIPQKGSGPSNRLLDDFNGSKKKLLLLPKEGSEDRHDASKALISSIETEVKQGVEDLDKNAHHLSHNYHHNTDVPVDETGSKGKSDDYYDEGDNKNVDEDYDDAEKHTGLLKPRLPKCILIGVSKAGTSALLFFLNMHPKIRISQKEVHYFDLMQYYDQGLKWYKEQMPPSYADQITIEKTPSYFVSFKVPSRIHRTDSSMKLMVIVREPVSRAISQYLLMRKRSDRHNLPFPSFESLAINPLTGNVNRTFKAVRSSVYYDYMFHWLQYFPRDQILIVDGDNFRKVPWEEISKVESFLGVDHLLSKEQFVWNDVKHFYCYMMDSGEKNCLPEYKGRKHPTIDPQVIQKLKDYYRPMNEKFYRLVGQRFDWDQNTI